MNPHEISPWEWRSQVQHPEVVSAVTFSSNTEVQHSSFGFQPSLKKARNHSGPSGQVNLSGKPDDWPQNVKNVKEYVEQCFIACKSEEDKGQTEKLLKEILQAQLQGGSNQGACG